MIRLSHFYFLFALILLTAYSCGTDETPVEPTPTCVEEVYDSGVYISNEGPFTDGIGTITHYNPSDQSVQETAFTINNCDDQLGNIVQSIALFENTAYIIVNNSNKIIVAEGSTLEKTGEISGLELPRYFLPVGDDKAFVSQWGADGVSGSVAVIDLNTLSILKTIPTGAGPENMIRIDNEVYVANVGGFARDSTVSVISTSSEEMTATIVVGDNPQSFAIDNTSRLWCLSKGYSDFYEPLNNTPGKLSILDGGQISQSIDIPTRSSWLAINNSGNELYYLAFGGIFKQSVSSNTAESDPFIMGNFYSMAVDFNTDEIYASDALDFSSKGVIYRYQADGTLINSFDSGIIPGGFWFD